MSTAKSTRKTAADVWAVLEMVGWVLLAVGVGSMVVEMSGGEYPSVEVLRWAGDRPLIGAVFLAGGIVWVRVCSQRRRAVRARRVLL